MIEQPSTDSFSARLRENGHHPLRRTVPTTCQLNLGKLCNQSCEHCHVEAGPGRKEILQPHTAQRVLDLIAASPEIERVDITGGAPEMNPCFRDIVSALRTLQREICVRSNLTILVQPGYETTIPFLAEHQVSVIASLPCYTEENVDRQRGDGVFQDSIEALRRLNAAGYGQEEGALSLDLVYNPLGPTLPPPQDALEKDYKLRLHEDFGIRFNRLFAITNVPIKRFSDMLDKLGQREAYQELLANHFNPRTVPDLMCRHQVSVDWEGRLYDCDFNQMLDLPLGKSDTHHTVWEIERLSDLDQAAIGTASHCFACTAGAGSSCGGTLDS